MKGADHLNGVWLLGAAQGMILCSGLVTHMVAARCLGPADYSRYALIIVIELFLLVFLCGGIPQAVRRFVSLGPENLSEGRRRLRRLHLPLSLGVAGLLSIGSPLLARAMGDSELAVPLRWLGLEVLIRAGILEPCLILLNGAGRHGLQSAIVSTYSFSRLLLVSAALALGGGLVGCVLALIAAAIVAAAVAARAVGVAGGSQAAGRLLQPGLIRSSFFYFFLHDVSRSAMISSNIYIVDWLLADGVEAGVYSACFMAARTPLAAGQALGGGTFSRLASAFSMGRIEEVRDLMARSVRGLALIMVPVAIFSLAQGANLIGLLYGKGYSGSGLVPGTLVAGMCGLALSSFLGEALNAAGALAARLRIVLALFFVHALAAVTLTRVFGQGGGAIALLFAATIAVGSMAVALSSLVGPFVPWKSLARITCAALPMLLTAFGYAGMPRTVGVMVAIVFAGITYPVLLSAIGEPVRIR